MKSIFSLVKRTKHFQGTETVFTQGDPARYVMYIQEGSIKLTVVNRAGKEAVVAILGPGDLLGEECLSGQSLCAATATAITDTTVLHIEKNEMIRLLHEECEVSDRFIAYMLERNARAEEELIDQLLNSCEKRLARTLLRLARCGTQGGPQIVPSGVSQEVLAEMIGTTRPRVNHFMNKFRKLGFIDYAPGSRTYQINKSLRSFVQAS
jgi:CRP/FNR family cyclic AMP-dependent transcriptional regulator